MDNIRDLQVYAHLSYVPLLADIPFYTYTSHDIINIFALNNQLSFLDDLSKKKKYIHIYLLT